MRAPLALGGDLVNRVGIEIGRSGKSTLKKASGRRAQAKMVHLVWGRFEAAPRIVIFPPVEMARQFFVLQRDVTAPTGTPALLRLSE